MSSLALVEDDHAPTVDPARFRGPDDRWLHRARASLRGTLEDRLTGKRRGELR